MIGIFAISCLSVFGQGATVSEATADLKKLLKKNSKNLSDVHFDGCMARVKVTTTQMDFRPNHSAPPAQGTAGFPTGDYGAGNYSSESYLIYKSKDYSFDLAQVVLETVITQESSVRGRKFAHVGFFTADDSIVVKSGKKVEFTSIFRAAINPKSGSKVADAFRTAVSACAASK